MMRLLICTIVSAMITVELFGQTTQNPAGQDETLGFELPQKIALFKFPGIARDISIKGNEFWGIHTNNTIMRFEGKSWRPVSMAVRGGYFNSVPVNIAASPDGYAYVTSDKSYIYRWNPRDNIWEWITATPGLSLLKQLSASNKEYVVGVNHLNDIFMCVNTCGRGMFNQLPGKALFITIGVDNEVWIVDMNHKIQRWNNARYTWEVLPGFGNTVDLMNKTRAVMTSESNRIYVWNGEYWREVGDRAHRATIDENAIYSITETDDIMMTLDAIV